MQIVDHRGNPISSGKLPVNAKAARMFLQQRLAAGYDSAATTNNNERHWANADDLSADAANNTSVRQTLRRRSRYEVANNCYARGIINTLANDIVGTGAHLQMNTSNETFNQDVEVQFAIWAKEIRLSEKIMTATKSKIESGEAFLMFINNPKLKGPVKIDLLVIESDQVRDSFTTNVVDDPKNIDGIKFDDQRNPISYNIPKDHPGSTNISPTEEDRPIKAADVIHLFRADRPGQSRGVPEITAALPLFALLRRYTLAAVQSAELAADMSWLIETQHSSLETIDLQDAEAFDAVELERGMGMVIPAGWHANQMKAEQPTTNYGMFKDQILNEIARCLGVPFNIAAGNSKDYNFASGRLDHQTYFKSIDNSQDYTSITVYDRILARFLFEATRVRGLLTPSLGLGRKVPIECQRTWLYDGHEHIDPVKEARADDFALKNFTTTLQAIYAKKGKDWRPEVEQIAKEKDFLAQKGLTIEDVAQSLEDQAADAAQTAVEDANAA